MDQTAIQAAIDHFEARSRLFKDPFGEIALECMQLSLHRLVEARVTVEAFERPKINDDDRKLINETPALMSVLYDVDLLPEQLMSQENVTIGLVKAYHRLYGILLGYRVAVEAAFLPSPQVTREEIAKIVCHYATGPSDANSCCPEPDEHKRCQRKADRILSLFYGKAKP